MTLFPSQTTVQSPDCLAMCTQECQGFRLDGLMHLLISFEFNRGKQSTPQIVGAFFPEELDSPDGSLQLHSNYVIAKLLQNHRNHSTAFLRATAAAQCSKMIAAFEWTASLKAEHKGTYNGIPSQAQRCSCLMKPLSSSQSVQQTLAPASPP